MARVGIVRAMLVIRTKSGTEIRIPLDDVDTITQIEPRSGDERPVPRIYTCTAKAYIAARRAGRNVRILPTAIRRSTNAEHVEVRY